jgi:hypothetical protein
MKILRLSAMALAAALGCSIGCGGSSCGGTNVNSNSNTPSITCGPGTSQVNGVCVLNGAVNTK